MIDMNVDDKKITYLTHQVYKKEETLNYRRRRGLIYREKEMILWSLQR